MILTVEETRRINDSIADHVQNTGELNDVAFRRIISRAISQILSGTTYSLERETGDRGVLLSPDPWFRYPAASDR